MTMDNIIKIDQTKVFCNVFALLNIIIVIFYLLNLTINRII